MALINCPDCGTDVSDAAPACPKCARPIAVQPAPARVTPTKKKSSVSPLGLTALIVVAIVIWANIPSSKPDSSNGQQTSSTLSPTDTSGNSASTSDATSPPSSPPSIQHEVVTKTPAELYQEYTANEVATDQSLAGKIIQITAPVKSIDKDFTDTAVLKFAADGDDFDDMSTALDDSEKDQAAHLSKGQIVTVQCKTMHRIMNSPVGSDCVLVNNPSATEPVSSTPTTQTVQPSAAPVASNPSDTSTQRGGAQYATAAPASDQVSTFTPTTTPLQKVVANASGPSFDCSAATDVTAKTICGDPQLSLLDRQMAIFYYTRTDYATNSSTRDSQREWIRDRDSSCIDNINCLTARYTQRINQLQGQRLSDATSGTQTHVVGDDAIRLNQYAAALQGAIHRQWIHPKSGPSGNCLIHIEQLAGGTVVSAKVDASCPYDDQDRASVENAVWSAQPLPYKGFETVFQRNIDLTFSP